MLYWLLGLSTPVTATSGQLHLTDILSSTENLRSPLDRIPPILTPAASVLPEDEIHEENDHDHKQNTADMEDDLSDSLGDNLGDIRTNNPGKPEPTTQSEITSMRKMMEEQREMLNNAI